MWWFLLGLSIGQQNSNQDKFIEEEAKWGCAVVLTMGATFGIGAWLAMTFGVNLNSIPDLTAFFTNVINAILIGLISLPIIIVLMIVVRTIIVDYAKRAWGGTNDQDHHGDTD